MTKKDWVDEYIIKATDDRIECFADEWSSEIDYGTKCCESPIERAMLVAIKFKLEMDFGCVAVNILDGEGEEYGSPKIRTGSFLITPQARFGTYRVDLVVEMGIPGERLLIIVECDGHEFHERTKEQARRDKARDRSFTVDGIHVLRFTGSEIYRDVEACAGDVVTFFVDELFRRSIRAEG